MYIVQGLTVVIVKLAFQVENVVQRSSRWQPVEKISEKQERQGRPDCRDSLGSSLGPVGSLHTERECVASWI